MQTHELKCAVEEVERCRQSLRERMAMPPAVSLRMSPAAFSMLRLVAHFAFAISDLVLLMAWNQMRES